MAAQQHGSLALQPHSGVICSCTTDLLLSPLPCAPCCTAPGAYQGRGRGNAFLNDLCDADVLVHVVDVSGTTDSKGVAMSAGPGAAEGDDTQQPGQQQPGGQADAGGEDPVEEVRLAVYSEAGWLLFHGFALCRTVPQGDYSD
jgi:hypothetical protein